MLHSSLGFSNVSFAVLNSNIQRLKKAMEVGYIFLSTKIRRLLSFVLFSPLFSKGIRIGCHCSLVTKSCPTLWGPHGL